MNLTKEQDKQLYKTSIGTEADDVIIGDPKSVDFKPSKKKEISCLFCNHNFIAYFSHKRIYCSVKCYSLSKKGKIPSNIEILKRSSIGKKKNWKNRNDWLKKCSLCKIGKFIGEKAGNWKGGITPKNHLIRNSPNYNNWRKEVFSRDAYTCQKCGIHSGNGKAVYLEAHHIKSFAEHQELRFNVDNGITVCVSCHCQMDKHRYGKK